MYGDAEVTVSTCKLTTAPVGVGRGSVGGLETLYLNTVVPEESVVMTSLTTNCPSYPLSEIPSTWNEVSTSKPNSASLSVTVIVSVETTPSPALILEIPMEPP